MRWWWRGGGGIKWERLKECNLWRPRRACLYHLFTLLKLSLLWWRSQGAHACTHRSQRSAAVLFFSFLLFFFTSRFTATDSVFTSVNLGLWSSPLTKASIKLVTPTSQLPALAYIAQIPIWYSWFLCIWGWKALGGWRHMEGGCFALPCISEPESHSPRWSAIRS